MFIYCPSVPVDLHSNLNRPSNTVWMQPIPTRTKMIEIYYEAFGGIIDYAEKKGLPNTPSNYHVLSRRWMAILQMTIPIDLQGLPDKADLDITDRVASLVTSGPPLKLKVWDDCSECKIKLLLFFLAPRPAYVMGGHSGVSLAPRPLAQSDGIFWIIAQIIWFKATSKAEVNILHCNFSIGTLGGMGIFIIYNQEK